MTIPDLIGDLIVNYGKIQMLFIIVLIKVEDIGILIRNYLSFGQYLIKI